MNPIRLFGSFSKLTKQDDGTIIVEGIASSEAVDSDGEIVKADAMRAALPDFMRFGNIREMHQPLAAGVAMGAEVSDEGKTSLTAHIVDPVAVAKCIAGVYKGFSIGGRVTARDETNKAIVTGVRLSEISLVDRPANPEAVFTLGKVAERDDVNPKEGESKYGDVRFADAKNKKYPIDTVAHIRAAFNYINHPKNAGKYSSADAASIKAKIVAAWKSKIDPKGPPSADEDRAKFDHEVSAEILLGKAAAAPVLAVLAALRGDRLEKGLYTVANLATLLDSLFYLQQNVAQETAQEGDRSILPDELKDTVKDLGEILEHMVAEEVEELYDMNDDTYPSQTGMAMAEQIGTLKKAHDILAKRGAKNSAETMEKLQSMHDTLYDMTDGAVCDSKDDEKGAKATTLKKAHAVIYEMTSALKQAHDELAKTQTQVAELSKACTDAVLEIEKLKAEPALSKMRLKIVTKGEDYTPAEDEKVITPVSGHGEVVNKAATAIKAKLAQGGRSLLPV